MCGCAEWEASSLRFSFQKLIFILSPPGQECFYNVLSVKCIVKVYLSHMKFDNKKVTSSTLENGFVYNISMYIETGNPVYPLIYHWCNLCYSVLTYVFFLFFCVFFCSQV